MSETHLIQLLYLLAAVLFIYGMKRLSSPKGARLGNALAAIGMLIAILTTIALLGGHFILLMIIAIVIGTAVGAAGAYTVPMTAMPQMVALFNGAGGGAAAAIATSEFLRATIGVDLVGLGIGIPMAFATIVGSISFTGSIIAFGKLQGIVSERPMRYPFQTPSNMGVLAILLALAVIVLAWTSIPTLYVILFIGALIFGVLFVLPIGGADMPVVIALLNAFTGLAVAADGFAIHNVAMIIAGTLVGSSGTLLTILMCKAMNRSLTNVLFAGVGGAVEAPAGEGEPQEDIYAGRVKSSSAEEVAMLLMAARRVVIVPGYGLAVAQGQHAVRDLDKQLEDRGIEVEYGIHPVAGRMPGHMNVLLAEADVPYEKLKEMDEINSSFKETDVVLVIGANDVVNPIARKADDPSNPIAGMPILNVDEAQTVVIIKRSLSPGFAGIANPLFAEPNTLMLFGDGKQMLTSLIAALKSAG